MSIPIHFSDDWLPDFQHRYREDGPWDNWDLFQLAYQGAEATAIEDFDELQCLKQLPDLEPYPHQLDTARKVIDQMHGRAILADEVGLGKTIEAGLVLKEYMIRGLVKRVLILVPASLVMQWTRELNQKFGIPAVAQKKAYMWKQHDVIVASMDTAKRAPHREHVLDQSYDMLIIDEAHKLKNKNTKNYAFAKQIKKKFCLLLTATPVQNKITELYNLITLLKPGHLGPSGSFRQAYVQGKREAKNQEELKKEIRKVMIRNQRSDGNIHFTKRHVETVPVTFTEEERDLYDSVTRFVREQYHRASGNAKSALSLITLQREICSSKEAAFLTLANMFKKCGENSEAGQTILEIVEKIKRIERQSKAEKTLELIRDIDDKVIVFTEYRATQNYLQYFLHQHGITSVPFRGGFRRNKKDWMRELFQNRAQVLIATEAGGEGINLQFCNRIINYDMPWNPMRVEQRIGRIHRLGQERDVHIYNLSTRDTIEAHILQLLYEKIHLFEMVIGQLDSILERLNISKDLEKNITQIVLESDSQKEMEIKLDNMGRVIEAERQAGMEDEDKRREEVM